MLFSSLCPTGTGSPAAAPERRSPPGCRCAGHSETHWTPARRVWDRRAAHIPCQCQHGKHRRAAAFDGSRCFAERSRPEDSHRKAADRTAEQSHKRHGNKDDTQIRCHAQHTAVLHKTVQVQPIAELAVDQSCRSHQQGERHRTGEVAHGFGDAQTLLCKRRCPLAHCLLRMPQKYAPMPDSRSCPRTRQKAYPPAAGRRSLW